MQLLDFKDANFLIAFALSMILLILLVILVARITKKYSVQKKFVNALQRSGITVVDSEEKKNRKPVFGVLNKFMRKRRARNIIEEINALVEQEKLLRPEERSITKSIVEILNKAGIVHHKEKPKKEEIIVEEDIKKVLRMTDDLLEKLPEDVVENFVSSPEFELYKKVIKKARE